MPTSTPTSSVAPRRLLILALLALAGVGISVSLTQHFYEVRGGSSGFKSFCNVNSTINCDVVAASPYAELVPGLPVSTFGAGWFLALFLVALIGRNPYWRREALRAALVLTALGTAAAGVYFGIMAGVIRTYCLLCLAADALNVVGLALVLSLHPEGFSKHKPDRTKWRNLTLLILGSLATVGFGLHAMQGDSVPSSTVNELVESVMSTPPISMNVSEDFASIGPANAPVTIVEFSDFQCPFCRGGAFILNALTNRYPGKLRVVFRNFPLDPSCNRGVTHSGHQFACEAARAAYCARKQGHFEQAYQELFEKQATFAAGVPTQLVLATGVDSGQLQGCMNAPETAAAIARDIDDGVALGIKSTPTFFINGRKVEGAYPTPVWNRVIDVLLAGEGNSTPAPAPAANAGK